MEDQWHDQLECDHYIIGWILKGVDPTRLAKELEFENPLV